LSAKDEIEIFPSFDYDFRMNPPRRELEILFCICFNKPIEIKPPENVKDLKES
jgi:hypothetical protein